MQFSSAPLPPRPLRRITRAARSCLPNCSISSGPVSVNRRAAALARLRQAPQRANTRTELSGADIRQLIGSFEKVQDTIRQADPASKGEVYRELRLTLTYDPGKNKIRVTATPDAESCGVMVRVRGGTQAQKRGTYATRHRCSCGNRRMNHRTGQVDGESGNTPLIALVDHRFAGPAYRSFWRL